MFEDYERISEVIIQISFLEDALKPNIWYQLAKTLHIPQWSLSFTNSITYFIFFILFYWINWQYNWNNYTSIRHFYVSPKESKETFENENSVWRTTLIPHLSKGQSGLAIKLLSTRVRNMRNCQGRSLVVLLAQHNQQLVIRLHWTWFVFGPQNCLC